MLVVLLICIITAVLFQNCSSKPEEDMAYGPSVRIGGDDEEDEDEVVPLEYTNGGLSSCAVVNGKAYCWGNNAAGQLGDGTKINRATPTAVSTNVLFTKISIGTDHACGLAVTKEVYCWGANTYGQLGIGTLNESLTPVKVSNVLNVVEVVAGHYVSCALKMDTTVSCWGTDAYGQLGNSTVSGFSTVPVAVSALSGAIDIDASTGVVGANDQQGRVCAVTTVGYVLCWGYGVAIINNIPTPQQYPTATAVQGITNAKSIEVSRLHACVLLGDKTVQCWGDNTYGQLGIVTSTTTVPPAGKVAGLVGVTDIAVGMNHSCAVSQGGLVHCWGRNQYLDGANLVSGGQTGQDLAQFPAIVPTPYGVSILGAVKVDAGNAHTCVSSMTNELRCFGYNGYFQLGVPTPTFSFMSLLVNLPLQ